MNKKQNYLLCTISAALIVSVLYILIHETGHLIVMLSAGETIDDFSVFGAHVSGHGGEYTTASKLWLNANGAVLPVIVSFVYLLFFKKERQGTFYRMFSFFAGVVPAVSLFAWVIVPVIYKTGNPPQGDDVTHFLTTFSEFADPLFVSAAALVIIGLGIVIVIKKGVLHNYLEEIRGSKKK